MICVFVVSVYWSWAEASPAIISRVLLWPRALRRFANNNFHFIFFKPQMLRFALKFLILGGGV